MKKLKIAVIGSGSTYTPELIDGFLKRIDKLNVAEFYMMDIDDRKNSIVSSLSRRMVKAKGLEIPVIETSDLETAITGADYIIAQIRVGKLAARILDEKIPLKYDLMGQETVGAGGFFKALRTIPVINNIADIIEKKAPNAWLINFSNPSGILMQMLTERGGIKCIGLCNAPIGIEKTLRRKLGGPVNFDFVGLNHFNWITSVIADGKEQIDKLVLDPDFYGMSGTPGGDFMRAIKAIPSYYLSYYYNPSKSVASAKARATTRGEDCVAIEEDLLKLYQDETLAEKPALLDKRGGAFYSEAACSLIEAIENDTQAVHVVNVANCGMLPFLAPGDVAEIKCRVGKNGPAPLPLINPTVSQHIIGMIQSHKAYEKLTVQAGLHGDYDAGLAALMTNPLVGDCGKVKLVFDEMLEAHKAYLPHFYS